MEGDYNIVENRNKAQCYAFRVRNVIAVSAFRVSKHSRIRTSLCQFDAVCAFMAGIISRRHLS